MKFFKKRKKSIEEDPSPKVSDPQVVQIENNSKHAQEFVVFGSNLHLNQPNFGNQEDIVLTNISDKVPYSSVLNEMLTTSYKIGLIRVQSGNPKNLSQTLYYNKYNPNVGMYEVVFSRREIKLSVMRDAYQFQSDILDARLPNLEMDKHHYISGIIEPKSVIVLALFPTEIESIKFEGARLSGKNVAPVIIHTTPAVKRALTNTKNFFNRLKKLFKKKNTNNK